MYLENLHKQIQIYQIDLALYLKKNNLQHLIKGGVDHVAIKATSTQEYEQWIEYYLNQSIHLSYTNMNNRRISLATLNSPFDFKQLGTTQYLEIMEPKPEKAGQGLTGMEHIEIYAQNLNLVKVNVDAANIDYKYAENPSHKAIVIQINKEGQEVKFTDRHLSDIVKEEIDKGKATILK